MKMSYGLYRRFLEDLANLKEPVVNTFHSIRYTQTILPFNLCRKKFGQHWILCFKKTHHHNNVVEWMDKRTYVSMYVRIDHNLLNITSETFSYILTHSAMFSCLAWSNSSDKQTSY